MCVCVRAPVPPFFLLFRASSLAFGNCNGLAVVDYLQKTILLCMSTLDMYGAADPYQRLTRSPRRNRQSTSGNTHTHTSSILPLYTYTNQSPCSYIIRPIAIVTCFLFLCPLHLHSFLFFLLSFVPFCLLFPPRLDWSVRCKDVLWFLGIICLVVLVLINFSAGLIWSKPFSLDQYILIRLMVPLHMNYVQSTHIFIFNC